jgi:hypothetical protein
MGGRVDMRSRKKIVKGLVGLVCLGFIVVGWVSNPKLVVVSSLIANRIPFWSPFASVHIEDRLLTVELDSDCNTYIYEEDMERVELVINKVAKNRFVREEIDDIRVIILNENGVEVYDEKFPNDDVKINLTWTLEEALEESYGLHGPKRPPKND